MFLILHPSIFLIEMYLTSQMFNTTGHLPDVNFSDWLYISYLIVFFLCKFAFAYCIKWYVIMW